MVTVVLTDTGDIDNCIQQLEILIDSNNGMDDDEWVGDVQYVMPKALRLLTRYKQKLVELDIFGSNVAMFECTCEAWPTQYEGELKNGWHFYFRYRFGGASLRLSKSKDDIFDTAKSLSSTEDVGDGLDGTMTQDDFIKSFSRLFSRFTEEELRQLNETD